MHLPLFILPPAPLAIHAGKGGPFSMEKACAPNQRAPSQNCSSHMHLIVLNDLCTIEDWNWIKTYFPLNNNGNRIIVATQQVEVASLC
uniref:NB-ARC domain-containing protein n=1 Tax=Aegilops tauschii subsp. strangulata TaxID=200361 RepID=A0A453QNY9_AEGTS